MKQLVRLLKSTLSEAPISHHRRRMLTAGFALTTGFAVAPAAMARTPVRTQGKRALALRNLHTGESLEAVYWRNGFYQPRALADINWVLRDHRADRATTMDRDLLDLLNRLERSLGIDGNRYLVTSGYRTRQTNAMLATRSELVAEDSFHMFGRAIDFHLPGVPLADVHLAALDLRLGGVGYYPSHHFIHVDTGPVRSW